MYARGTERYPNTVVAFCLFNYQTAHTFVFLLFASFLYLLYFLTKTGLMIKVVMDLSLGQPKMSFLHFYDFTIIHIIRSLSYFHFTSLSLSLSLSPPRSHTFLKLSDHIIKTIETQMYFQLLILIFREIVFHLYMVG